MRKNNESGNIKLKNGWVYVLFGVLTCLCLPFAEPKATASGALYFNGTTNSYMQFSGPWALYPQFYTIEFWLKPDSLSQTGNIICGTATNQLFTLPQYQPKFNLGLGAAGTATFLNFLNPDCEYDSFATPTGLISPETWTHVAIVNNWFSGSFPVGYLTYINGNLVSSNNSSTWSGCGTSFSWQNFGIMLLGQSGFAGDIGELRVWNRALTQSEIQAKMSEVLNPTNETGLVGYWRFTEGTSNIVYDLAGTNNGIIYGAAWSADLPNTALQPPTIFQQPANQTVFNGQTNVTIDVTVNGSQPIYYQWFLNGTNLTDTNVLGITSSTLTIPSVGLQDLGAYTVIVSNGVSGVTSSNAFLTMSPFLAAPYTGTTLLWGQDANLSVTPAGTGPFAYQWEENGVPIDGATNQTYTISGIQFTNAGFYSVVVSSPFGSVTNTPSQVVVNPAGVCIGMYPGVKITGTAGYNYSIQSTPSLSNTNGWITNTNLTLQTTQQIWFDSTINVYNPGNPQRFYRVVPGQ